MKICIHSNVFSSKSTTLCLKFCRLHSFCLQNIVQIIICLIFIQFLKLYYFLKLKLKRKLSGLIAWMGQYYKPEIGGMVLHVKSRLRMIVVLDDKF